MNLHTDRAAWLLGGYTLCHPEPPRPARPRRLVLLGAPGVGKGTQAGLLSANSGACQLSTGDVFRHALSHPAEKEMSPAMQIALDCMHRGELVHDETVLALITERIRCLVCSGGFLLDGFPRTVVQAEALNLLLVEHQVKLDAVISYEFPVEALAARTSGRRTCPACKAVYHLSAKPPVVEGICDRCGSKLVQRADDQPEAARHRLVVYEQSTAPLIHYYHDLGLLVSVDASGTPEEVFRRTVAALDAHDRSA